MIDRQGHLDVGDLDISHDAGVVHVQQAVIGPLLLRGQGGAAAPGGQVPVIGPGGVPQVPVAVRVQLADRLVIGRHRPGGVEGVPVVADGGVQQQRQPYKQYEK